MKSLYRALGLTVLVVLLSVGTVGAQASPEYGSCYLYCGDQLCEISFTTYSQCCFQSYQCPNGYGYVQGFYWNSYSGPGPQICVN